MGQVRIRQKTIANAMQHINSKSFGNLNESAAPGDANVNLNGSLMANKRMSYAP